MFRFFLIILSLCTALPSFAQTGDDITASCNDLNPNPKIIFRTSFGQLIHDISTPREKIQSHSTMSEKGILVDGLATVDAFSQIKINAARGIMLNPDNYCILPTEIEVYIGYRQPTIYVAKEYDIDSCRFSLIIRHEQTHQRINILTLQYFLPLFRQTIENTIREVRSVRVSSPQDDHLAIALLQQYYAAKLKPIMNEFEKARMAEQLKLDNNTNYAMEIDLCNRFDAAHQKDTNPKDNQ